jgi:hypothetical protein
LTPFKPVKAIEDFKKAQELDPSIIANEKIKALEKEIQWLGCNLGWLFQIVLNQHKQDHGCYMLLTTVVLLMLI